MALLSGGVFQYIASTGTATKVYTTILFTLSALHFYLWYTLPNDSGTPLAPYLTVVPGLCIWYPWTFVTASFVEISIYELLFSLLFVPPSLRYFERLWGSKETLKFILIVTTISNLIAFVLNWLEYLVTSFSELFLFRQEYYGQMAMQAALLVAYTQIIPEHQLVLFGSGLKLRVKRLPMIYVTISTVLCLLGFQTPYLLIQLGWLVSWTYLRFYKRTSMESSGSIETYGDHSETFAFIYWFPPFLHKPVGLLSNTVYSIATRLRLVSAWSSTGDIEAGYTSVPGGARAEAERRRALALKVLDQRLANNAAANASNATVGNQTNVASTSSEDTSRTLQKPPAPKPPPAASTNLTSTEPQAEMESGSRVMAKDNAS